MGRRRKTRKKGTVPAKPPPRRRAGKLWLGPALAVVLAAPVGWLLLRGEPRIGPRRLNVVLVSADTLRADKLGPYGNRSIATPALDRLARDGVVFENATTVAPVTLPAHASLFTGLYPLSHGVRDNGGYALPEERVTLAEALRGSGYRTGAFLGAYVLDARWGLDQGFERYFDDFDAAPFERGLASVYRRGEEVLAEALSWMETVRDERFFCWIHLYDPHTPYDPPEPYRGRYEGAPDGLYDGEVAYVDGLLGDLLDWLDARGLEDDTLVVFVGDHGESLGEHGEDTHGFFVYGATMRIPLLIRAPIDGLAGSRVGAQVRILDVMPTLLEMLGVDPPEDIQGESLVALLAGAEPDLGLAAYGESTFPAHYGWSELASLRTGEWHFIDAPRPELYDLANDPHERRNLARERAATVRELAGELEALRSRLLSEAAEVDPAAKPILDPKAEANLRALGYLGGSDRPRSDSSRMPADPKDKIELFKKIRAAAAALDTGEPEAGVEILSEVLEEDPEIVEVHKMLGEMYAATGRMEPAAASFRDALSRDPEYRPAIFGLASAYRDMGRTEDAVRGFERMLALDPDAVEAAFALAKMHVESGRFADALAILSDVNAVGADAGSVVVLRAEAQIGLGKLADAESSIRRALDESGGRGVPDARFFLGVVEEKRGNLESALREYEEELAAFPESSRAHFNVARVLGQIGRGDEMIDHLEAAIASNPDFAVAHLYLANAYLERGELDRAKELAERGIALGPEPSLLPFGHFILADVYQRLGRAEDAAREMAIAHRLRGS